MRRLLLLALLLPQLALAASIGGGSGGGGEGSGDIESVYDCASGACTGMTVASGESLGVSGTGTIAATSGDSATSFFSAGELERTLLPAASADCSAGDFAKGIDADLVLDCATPPGGTGDVTAVFSCASGDCNAVTVEEGETLAVSGSGTIAATTAAALAADPDDCGAGDFATAIAANGNLTCGAPALSDLTITAGAGIGISSDTISTASTEENFVTLAADADFNCGAGTKGALALMAGPQDVLSYCDDDDDGQGDQRYLAVASSAGVATSATALASNPTDCAANQFANTIAANGNLTCAAIADADVPDDITIDLAATATALAADPADCAANEYATTIAASGALTCAAITLGTNTTGNYALGDSEGGAATTGDSATSFFASGELERTLLPAASADCAANNWAKGIDADLVLDCAQPALANLSNGSLAKGAMWQGNSAGATTAYTAPYGRDIRTEGAVCDGSTDDAVALQAALDNAGVAFIPYTTTGCNIAATVNLSTGDKIIGAPGSRLNHGSGASGAMILGTTVNNVTIKGVIFNADQIKVDLVRCVTDCENFRLEGNEFWFNFDGDGASTDTTAFDYIELDCQQTAAGSEGCLIAHNTIYGSNTDAQNDRGINIAGAGGVVGLGTNLVIANNIIQNPGGDALAVSDASGQAGIVIANTFYGCLDNCIGGPWGQSMFQGNLTYSAGGAAAMDITGSNNGIVGNNFVSSSGAGVVRLHNGGGNFVDHNYLADGVQFVVDVATTNPLHNRAIGNVFSANSCADDVCILVENGDEVTIAQNTVTGTFGAAGGDAIRFVNKDTADDMMIDFVVSDNVLSLAGNASGVHRCIHFEDDVGTDVGNGFANGVISGNVCGDYGSTTIDNCIDITDVAEAANWDDIIYSGNNCAAATAGLEGEPGSAVVVRCANLGITSAGC